MFWKFLLTAGLIVAAYLTLRARMNGPAPAGARRPPTLDWGAGRHPIKILALAVLAIMALGSAWYLWRGWEYASRILTVQVVNASTGAIVPYQARRRDIDGRVIHTLDGREIRLADVERMILTEASQSR